MGLETNSREIVSELNCGHPVGVWRNGELVDMKEKTYKFGVRNDISKNSLSIKKILKGNKILIC